MAKQKVREELGRGERVVVTTAMPQIPEGTVGKVTFVAGFTWIRYWVRFDNGVTRGSLNRNKLARPAEYRALLDRRARGEEEPAVGPRAAVVEAATSNGSTPGTGGIPAHLLERTKKRRELLGKPR